MSGNYMLNTLDRGSMISENCFDSTHWKRGSQNYQDWSSASFRVRDVVKSRDPTCLIRQIQTKSCEKPHV